MIERIEGFLHWLKKIKEYWEDEQEVVESIDEAGMSLEHVLSMISEPLEKEPDMCFSIGDVVTLSSGSKPMVVTDNTKKDDDTNMATVVWMLKDGEAKRINIPENCLKRREQK